MKIVREKLFEIGEASAKPYDTKYFYSSKSFEFTTEDGDEYVIKFLSYNHDCYSISFERSNISCNDRWEEVVNKGRMFRIMATLVECARFMDKNFNIKEFYYMPTKSKENDDRRSNIYMAYVEKILPRNYIIKRMNSPYDYENAVKIVNTEYKEPARNFNPHG